MMSNCCGRLERLTKGHYQPLPQLSEDRKRRLVMASKRRQEQQRAKREGIRLAAMDAIDKLADEGRIVIEPRHEANE